MRYSAVKPVSTGKDKHMTKAVVRVEDDDKYEPPHQTTLHLGFGEFRANDVLSKLVSKILQIQQEANDAHNDITVMGAPSECHNIVKKQLYETVESFLNDIAPLTLDDIYAEVEYRIGPKLAHMYLGGFRQVVSNIEDRRAAERHSWLQAIRHQSPATTQDLEEAYTWPGTARTILEVNAERRKR